MSADGALQESSNVQLQESEEYEEVAPIRQYADVLNLNPNDRILDEECGPEIDPTDGYVLPDFMDDYAAIQVKELQTSGVSGAAYDKALKGIESATYNYKNNPFYFVMYTYMEILPVGIIITAISALILKRKQK